MKRHLPPLNALRAFEAAGRHLSFTKAAEELGVTPAAVSHQVKALESQLGIPLFRRLTRALMLTDAGQTALPLLHDGFDRLEQAVERMRAHDMSGALRISAAPTFTAKWLVPRLDRFRKRHPDIDVRIDATNQLVDLRSENVDVAIRYGLGEYSGCRVDRLFADSSVAPICSPALLEGEAPLRDPRDLRYHTLLHVRFGRDLASWPSWEMWLRAAGLHDINAARGPVFAQESLAVQAAIEGHGVALASGMFIEEDLVSGRLVRPFALSLPLDFSYFAISREATANHPKIKIFRDWLLAEARRESI